MTRLTSLTLTTSLPEGPDDPSGHFVLSEVRRRARCDEGAHLVLAPGDPRAPSLPGLEASLVIERLGGGRAFGWPGVVARLREDPTRALSVLPFLARMRARTHAVDAAHVVAHWLLPCGLLALERGLPCTLWAHGSDVRLALRARLASPLARLARARPATFVFVAEHLRHAFLDALPRGLRRDLAQRSRVEPAPIDVEPGETPDVPLPARYFIWIGRLIPEKRPLIAARIAEEHGVNLVVLGDGPVTVAASPFVTPLGRRPRREVLALLARSQGLVTTSQEEGCSTVVREALALDRPVFALRTAGLDEGALVQAFDTDRALGRALRAAV